MKLKVTYLLHGRMTEREVIISIPNLHQQLGIKPNDAQIRQALIDAGYPKETQFKMV